jgi:hypothetical protein
MRLLSQSGFGRHSESALLKRGDNSAKNSSGWLYPMVINRRRRAKSCRGVQNKGESIDGAKWKPSGSRTFETKMVASKRRLSSESKSPASIIKDN